jgi:polysaccharide biosynthesis protein VpsQ
MTRSIQIRLIAFFFTLFIFYIIYAANTGTSNIFFDMVSKLPFGDKIGHVGLVGMLAFLINLLLNSRTFVFKGYSILVGSFAVFCFMTVEEFSQIWMDTRTFDLVDLTFNYLGIGIASWLIVRFFKR